MLFIEWQTSVAALLSSVFTGRNAQTCTYFTQTVGSPVTSHDLFDRLYSIFQSAKNQYEGGYLFDVRNLVHAEVFSDELEQAEHFLSQGYKVPAAVIAGTVLETTLRELCTQHANLQPADNINRMNDDLAREGVYNKMRTDQIRALAKIRNAAAHGKPDEFNDNDVKLMIAGIRDFIANQMS